MRTNWLYGLFAVVLSGAGQRVEAGTIDTISTYSYIMPFHGGGGVNGQIVPVEMSSYFYFEQPYFVGPGKGASATGQETNPSLRFRFGVNGNSIPMPNGATPDMFPDWANQSVQTNFEVRESTIKFVQDGDTYIVYFEDQFNLNGHGGMGLNFYQPNEGGNWVGNGWLNANFNLANIGGAHIREINPFVEHTTILDGDNRYEQIYASINGVGEIPGSAYTIARVVPEPATMVLYALGGAVSIWWRRKRNLIA